MPKRLFYSLVILICIYLPVLLITGGYTLKFGLLTFSSHKTSGPILLLIILVITQFIISADFRRVLAGRFSVVIDHNRYFLCLILGFFCVGLLLGCLHFLFYDRVLALDLDREYNFATYFSAFLFLLNGLVAGTIFRSEKKSGFFHLSWWFIAFVFFYLALDEVGRFHESLIPLLRKNIPLWNSVFDSSRYWVLVLAPIIFLTVIYFFWFLYRELKGFPWITAGLIIALLLWVFIICLEWWELKNLMTYKYKALVEEGSEMLSSILFLSVFFGYLRKIR